VLAAPKLGEDGSTAEANPTGARRGERLYTLNIFVGESVWSEINSSEQARR